MRIRKFNVKARLGLLAIACGLAGTSLLFQSGDRAIAANAVDASSYIHFDSDFSVWNKAVNQTENVGIKEYVSGDTGSWNPSDSGAVMIVPYSVNYVKSGDSYSVTKYQVRWCDDTRATGWWENLRSSALSEVTMRVPFIFYSRAVSSADMAYGYYGYPFAPYVAVSNQSSNPSYWGYYMPYTNTYQASIQVSYIEQILNLWLNSNVDMVMAGETPSIRQQGYDSGYTAGYSDGQGEGYTAGYSEGKRAGDEAQYDRGYYDGLSEGSSPAGPITAIFMGITSVPISVLNGLGSFTILDVPVVGLLLSFMFLAIIAWMVRRLI